jgi:hypothetical protein
VYFYPALRSRQKSKSGWADLKVWTTTIRDARSNLGFKFPPPMIKQNLSPEQRFQRYQFGFGMLVKNLDLATIIFSEECCLVLGRDKRWRRIRRGQSATI